MKKILALVVTSLMLVATSAANALVIWEWEYESLGAGGQPNGLISASGLLTTAGDALVPELVQSISGQRNGHSITGLVPLSSNSSFSYDNLVNAYYPGFSFGGVLFKVDDLYVNIYYDNALVNKVGRNLHFESTFDGVTASEDIISFNLNRVNPIPEPETYALFLLGLGLMGVMVKRRTPSQQ